MSRFRTLDSALNSNIGHVCSAFLTSPSQTSEQPHRAGLQEEVGVAKVSGSERSPASDPLTLLVSQIPVRSWSSTSRTTKSLHLRSTSLRTLLFQDISVSPGYHGDRHSITALVDRMLLPWLRGRGFSKSPPL